MPNRSVSVLLTFSDLEKRDASPVFPADVHTLEPFDQQQSHSAQPPWGTGVFVRVR